MRENKYRSTITRAVEEAGGRGLPVENVAQEDTPDMVITLDGITLLAELKSLESLPARPETAIKIRHYTLGQLRFLIDWWKGGGNALLAVRSPTGESLLFTPTQAIRVYAGLPWDLLRCNAAWKGYPRGLAQGLLQAVEMAHQQRKKIVATVVPPHTPVAATLHELINGCQQSSSYLGAASTEVSMLLGSSEATETLQCVSGWLLDMAEQLQTLLLQVDTKHAK